MRKLLWIAMSALLAAPVAAQAKDPIGDSVVKIYATRREPDFVRPWSKSNPQEVAGSGAIIEGKRILTAAHMVLYASQILVQPNQSTERVPASVVAVAPGVDLAVIKLENPSSSRAGPPCRWPQTFPH